MKTLNILSALCLLLGACSSSSFDNQGQRSGEPSPSNTTTPTPTSTEPPMGATKAYSMQFDGFKANQNSDGLRFGAKINLRFAFDLQKAEQTYYPPLDTNSSNFSGWIGQVTPKIISSRESLGGFCGGEAVGDIDLPPGDPAWVEYLDLTMISTAPTPSDGSPPESPGFNALCYGYRKDGIWHWEMDLQYATWDPGTKTYRMRFTIQQGPIDAIKVFSGNGGQFGRLLEEMVLTTKPQ